jgi:hypothetical protein
MVSIRCWSLLRPLIARPPLRLLLHLFHHHRQERRAQQWELPLMSSSQQLPEEWKDLSTRPPERPVTSTRRSISRSGSGRAGGRVAGVATGNQHGTHGITQTTTTTTIISITGIAVIAFSFLSSLSTVYRKARKVGTAVDVHDLRSGEKRCLSIKFLQETFRRDSGRTSIVINDGNGRLFVVA